MHVVTQRNRDHKHEIMQMFHPTHSYKIHLVSTLAGIIMTTINKLFIVEVNTNRHSGAAHKHPSLMCYADPSAK